MQPRPTGPLPALVALLASAVFLFVSLNVVEEANAAAFVDEPAYRGLMAWGGAWFLASMAAGIVSIVLCIVQPPRTVAKPTIGDGAIAPAVELMATARGFVLRLHKVLLTVGGMVLLGGLGLVAAASLVADGTATSPFDIPGKVWVVRLNVWQVHVTLWAFLQLGIALALWGREYSWVRHLRHVWSQPSPEV